MPSYQRVFVWKEKDITDLINAFKNNQFVPPIIIGAFKNKDNFNENLIIDGQQRLTSIFLAYLEIFPDKDKYKQQ